MSANHTTSPTTASQRKQWTTFFAFFALLLAMTGLGLWWSSRTYHFTAVQEGVLYRAGNRGVSELGNAVHKSRAKTVVSLIDDDELNDENKAQFKKEADMLSRAGVRQERIPVKLGGWPGGDDIKRFLAIVADPANRPVLVHCAQGVRRTGMFVAAYQESVLGYDKAKAKDAILTFGHSERVADDVKAFIDGYDPATMMVATTMPVTANE